MAYVALNPLHAGMAARPEETDHTLIKEAATDGASAQALLMPFDVRAKCLGDPVWLAGVC